MDLTGTVVIVCFVAAIVTWVSALIDASRTPARVFVTDGRSKASVVLLVLCTGAIGGTYYWLVIRRHLEQPTTPPMRN